MSRRQSHHPAAAPPGPGIGLAAVWRICQSALFELEFALTIAQHVFTRCMAAAGGESMALLKLQAFHLIHHRARPNTLADNCLVLNIEDMHLTNYAARKLTERGLVETGRKGNEQTVAITAEGVALCARYGEALLVLAVRAQWPDPAEISRLASLRRALSGSYDQAARSATSL